MRPGPHRKLARISPSGRFEPFVDDRPEPTEAEQEAFIAELQENGRRCAERVERSWWREPLRAVLATGDQELIDDFVELFKRAEARRFKRG